MSSSFARLARVVASTERPAPLVGGKRGAAVAALPSLTCTPLDPAGDQLRDEVYRRRPELRSAYTLLVTYVDAALDVQEGDVLVVGTQRYTIRLANHWTWRDAQYLQLVLEQPQ